MLPTLKKDEIVIRAFNKTFCHSRFYIITKDQFEKIRKDEINKNFEYELIEKNKILMDIVKDKEFVFREIDSPYGKILWGEFGLNK